MNLSKKFCEFPPSFFVQKVILQLFCTYGLCLYFFVKRKFLKIDYFINYHEGFGLSSIYWRILFWKWCSDLANGAQIWQMAKVFGKLLTKCTLYNGEFLLVKLWSIFLPKAIQRNLFYFICKVLWTWGQYYKRNLVSA